MKQQSLERLPVTVDEFDPGWRRARAAYFAGITMRHFDAMRMHVDDDGAESAKSPFKVLRTYRDTDGQMRYLTSGNSVRGVNGADSGHRERSKRPDGAIQHSMVEAARGRVLGSMLGLETADVARLEKAALLHDSYKAREAGMMRRNGLSSESYDAAQANARKEWENSGLFEKDVMDAAAMVGHTSLDDTLAILAKPDEDLTAKDKICLAMHYIDDITINSAWSEAPGSDGNDIDRRMDRAEANPRYKLLNRPNAFTLTSTNDNGVTETTHHTAYWGQRYVGHLVEARLTNLVCAANELPPESINPLELMVVVDNQIKAEIMAAAEV